MAFNKQKSCYCSKTITFLCASTTILKLLLVPLLSCESFILPQHLRQNQVTTTATRNFSFRSSTLLLAKPDIDDSYADTDEDSTKFPDSITSVQPQQQTTGYDSESGYSRTLVNKSERKRLARYLRRNRLLLEQKETEMNEDGYADMEINGRKRKFWKKVLLSPYKAGRKVTRIFRGERSMPEPGTLILIRHGESDWNANKTFTGWADPDLSPQGFREMQYAARLLLEGGYEIDIVFTSRLKRAIRSTYLVIQEFGQVYLPVFKSWRLNERMYGALTGLSKKETAEQLGAELVQSWRGSLNSRPPPLSPKDHFWPGRLRQYYDLDASEIPLTESLNDCMIRTRPVWEKKISYQLLMGRNVMVVAHANTLRGLVKTIDGIGDEEIQEVSIPTGIPIIYKFDKSLKPIPPTATHSASQQHMSGQFLEKPGVLKEALKREEEWGSRVPGYDFTMNRPQTPLTSLERSLIKLKAERELGEWAKEFVDFEKLALEDDGNDGNMGRPIEFIEDQIWEEALRDLGKGSSTLDVVKAKADIIQTKPNNTLNQPLIIKDGDEGNNEDGMTTASVITNTACLSLIPSENDVSGIGEVPIRKDAVIVMIRHGKTANNQLGIFTGWEDVALAPEGIEEAKEAGKLLKKHGFEFDVVYSSWLSRAVETAWLVMDEMDCLWLPIIKSWRLNERMYGALSGLSKRMVAQRNGEEQFKAWRRGYKVRPPAVSSFSQHYPGNDKRYMKYLNDVRYSFRESLIRSIESGKPALARKLPKTESLYDCMQRTIPYFENQIVPEAINQGKRVLISSSENAIRGLLMNLCEIPEDVISGLEIPNGLPLIFDVNSKCIKLLDDGSGIDPLLKHNFGSAASYLFRPCQNEDGSDDDECDIRFMTGTTETLDFIRRPTTAPAVVET